MRLQETISQTIAYMRAPVCTSSVSVLSFDGMRSDTVLCLFLYVCYLFLCLCFCFLPVLYLVVCSSHLPFLLAHIISARTVFSGVSETVFVSS